MHNTRREGGVTLRILKQYVFFSFVYPIEVELIRWPVDRRFTVGPQSRYASVKIAAVGFCSSLFRRKKITFCTSSRFSLTVILTSQPDIPDRHKIYRTEGCTAIIRNSSFTVLSTESEESVKRVLVRVCAHACACLNNLITFISAIRVITSFIVER